MDSNAFQMLQPLKVPGFCLSWLELVSHRLFMPKLLISKGQKVSYLLASHRIPLHG